MTALAPESILSKTLFQDDHIKVSLFHFAQGQGLGEHSSSKAAILQILQGDALLTLGNDERQVSTGAWIHMTVQLPHSVKALSPMSMLLTLLKQ